MSSAATSIDRPCPLAAAMCVSVPWNLTLSNKTLEKPIARFLFNSQLVKVLCRLVKQSADVLSTNFDVDKILEVDGDN